MPNVFEQLDAMKDHAPRAPDPDSGFPGDSDYAAFQLMPEHEKANYLSRKRVAAEQAFSDGFSKQRPLASGPSTPSIGYRFPSGSDKVNAGGLLDAAERASKLRR